MSASTSPFRDRAWVRVPRSLVSGLLFLAFGLGGLLIGGAIFPLCFLAGDNARTRRVLRGVVRESWRLFMWAGRVTGTFRVAVSPEDRARLAATRSRVVVANHLTLIDVVVLASLLPDSTSIAKAAAGRNFFYSRIVRSVFLVNDDPAHVRADAARLLGGGTNVIVFPEGTRQPVDAPERKLRRGAAQIALEAGVPILPVAITCDPPVLAKGQPWYDVGDRTIVWTLRVGAEIPVPSSVAPSARHAAATALTRTIQARLWDVIDSVINGIDFLAEI